MRTATKNIADPHVASQARAGTAAMRSTVQGVGQVLGTMSCRWRGLGAWW